MSSGVGQEFNPDDEVDLLSAGTVVGHYEVIRQLGSGGMAHVYLARDLELGRRVALKLIQTRGLVLASPESFIREARTLAQFNHPNIITVFNIGTYKDAPYIAMEFVEGDTLRRRMETDTLSLREIQRLALGLVQGIEEAHRRNIIHGDLKPENIIISREGRLRILDFGLSKLFGGDEPLQAPVAALHRAANAAQHDPTLPAATLSPEELAARRATSERGMPTLRMDSPEAKQQVQIEAAQSGIQGTPAYMAPEQWRGETRTLALDMWAVGVILFELLTGRRPVESSNVLELCASVMSDALVPEVQTLRELPDELARTINACLQKAPNKRPTASDVTAVLFRLVHGVSAQQNNEEETPFRGLSAFTEEHAGYFFGRDDDISTLIERLRTEVVLPIVGASGVGKSSFIQAGVIPRLREKSEWKVLRMRPGADPFRALATRFVHTISEHSRRSTGGTKREAQIPEHHHDTVDPLSTGQDPIALAKELYDNPKKLALLLRREAKKQGCNVLLLVDQLEEACTLVADVETRMRFFAAICTAADDPSEPVRVVFTVRDDFLSRMAESPDARAALMHVMVLRAPGNDALREILTRPLQAVGYRYDDDTLVDSMIAAVQDETSALPLLQFCSSMLWERRNSRDKLLLRSSYDAIGGVQGALATHADAFMSELKESQTRLVRAALLRLVTPEGTRRVTAKRALLEALGFEVDDVLGRLTSSRLLVVRDVFEEPHYELSHESLVHNWHRLSTWLEEGREELLFLAEIEQASILWDKRGRPGSEVWTGTALAEALRNLDRFRSKLPEVGEAFIVACVKAEKRRLFVRRAVAVSGATLLAIIAVVSIVTAIRFGEKTKIAETERAAAQAEGARSAFDRNDYIAGQALLRTSFERQDSNLARSLWDRYIGDAIVWRTKTPGNIYDVDWSEDEKTIAVASEDSSVYLFDSVTAEMRVFRESTKPVIGVAWSDDGRYLAACDWGGNIHVWSFPQGMHRSSAGHDQGVCRVRFGSNGQFVSGGWDGKLYLWDAQTLKQRTIDAKGGQVGSSVIAGEEVFATHADGSLRAYSTASGSNTREWKLSNDALHGLLVAPDGKEAYVGTGSGEILNVRLADRTVKWRQQAHQAQITNIRWLGRNSIASTAEDKSLRRWDITTGQQQGEWSGHSGNAFAMDTNKAHLAVTGGYGDREVIVWDTARSRSVESNKGHSDPGLRVALSPSGELAASASEDRTVRLWRVSDGQQVGVLNGHSDLVNALAFSADGKFLASGGFDNLVHLWSVAEQRRIRTFEGHTSGIYGLAFVEHGELVSVSHDQTLKLWDVGTARLIKSTNAKVPLLGLAISGAGHMIATSYKSHVFFDNARSAPIQRAGAGFGCGFSSDGTAYFLASLEGEVSVLDAKTGRLRVQKKLPNLIAYWGSYVGHEQAFVVGFSDGVIRRFDDSTLGFTEWRGHRGDVAEAVANRAGTVVISTGDDSSVRAWNARSGRQVWFGAGLDPHSGSVLTHRGWSNGSLSRELPQVDDSTRAFAVSGTTLCNLTTTQIQLVDLQSGKVLQKKATASGQYQVAAIEGACLIGPVPTSVLDASGKVSDEKDSLFVTARNNQGIVIRDDEFSVWSTQRSTPPISTGRGLRAVTPVGSDYMLGFANGTLEVTSGDRRKTIALRPTPRGEVTQIANLEFGVVALGFSNGAFGIWSLQSGDLLKSNKVHGPVVQLHFAGESLFALSETGDFASIDLHHFTSAYCPIVEQISSLIPLVATDQGIALREGIACQR